MASFSFSAGNASKLARIPLYLAGRVVTAVLPRNESWVFGCGAGIGDGSLALWKVADNAGITGTWLVETDRDAQDAAALGIPTLPKYSFRGFVATARAGVIVVSHGFGDVNRYAVTGGFVAQLWHGIPLKRLGLDSPATTRFGLLPRSTVMPWLLSKLYRATQAGISLLPAASHLVRGRLESAFGLADERIVVTGEPRVDVLSQGEPATRRVAARDRIEAVTGSLPKNVVLYAPTWRDGAEDPAIPSADDWAGIAAVLDAQDAVLLVRSHPLGAGAYEPPFATDRVRPLGSDLMRDVTPALAGIDVLITDYSSLAYDAGLVPTPTLFLAPDVEQYARERGFYGRYSDVAGDDYAATWAELSPQLAAALGDEPTRRRLAARSANLSANVHDFRDGRNTERVFRAIEVRRARTLQKGQR